MISGGFGGAGKLAGVGKTNRQPPRGDPPDVVGKTPRASNRLARSEHADVVIMVGDALANLEKAGRTQPDSRRELADSPIGVVVKAGAPLPALSQRRPAAGGCWRRHRSRTPTAPAGAMSLDAVPHRALMTRCE